MNEHEPRSIQELPPGIIRDSEKAHLMALAGNTKEQELVAKRKMAELCVMQMVDSDDPEPLDEALQLAKETEIARAEADLRESKAAVVYDVVHEPRK